MSDRERWIVYPLLFMALGISLRDKFLREVHTDQVKCRELLVLNEHDEPMVVLNASASGGVIRAIGTENRPELVLGHEGASSGLF